jgi:Flp pilus assembly protein TadD
MKPDFAFAHGNLGVVLASIGRAADAQMEYELSLKYDPDQVDVLNNLAWLLATTSESSLHNGPRAVALAKRALALSADPAPELLGTLAAAYARAGEFELAIQMSSRAVDIAESRNRSELAALLAERQRLYETHQAYSESPPHP